MANKLVEYRLRIRNAANSADALEVTSVRGGTNPYISDEPSGDGATYDPITGVVMSGSFSVRIVDPITSGTSRLFTSQLEDANARQQLGHRRAFLEFREDGGAWQMLFAGRVTRYALASDIEWEVGLGDFMEAEHRYTAFEPHEADTFAAFLARWPNRGCLLGGPILNGFLHIADLGGWQFRIGAQGGVTGYTWTRFDYVSGYDAGGQPIPNTARLIEVRDAINAAAETFWEPNYENSPFGGFPELRVLVNGTAYEPARYVGDTAAYRRPRELLSTSVANAFAAQPCAFWLPGTVGTVGDIVRVHIITRKATAECPVYWTGHPVDLLTALWTEAGLPYSAAAVSTVKDAIGRGARLSLQVTSPQNIGRFCETAVYGPWGVGARMNSSGELEIFSGRIFANSIPATTITSADVAEGSTEAFELDAAEAIRTVTIEHTRLTQPVAYNILGQPYPDPRATAALVTQQERFERTNADPGAIGTGEVSYQIPGMVHFTMTSIANVIGGIRMREWVDGRAHEIYGRYGRGPIRLRTTILRTSAAMSAKVGDEILVNLPQLPNKNKRLLDDGTVPARAMQIVQLTPRLTGHRIECVDSGPNANAIATLPTLSIAKSAGAPRSVAEVTVTNAAALNAAGIAVRIQVAITTGAAPAAADYTDALYFRAGIVPTTATVMAPASASSTVYVRARSEQNGGRPSNWTAPISVALDPLNAPTALVATPVVTDGRKCDLTWVVGASAGDALVEIFRRGSAEAFAAAVLVEVLPAGSTYFRLERLTPGASYTVSVRHLDEATGDRSALTEVTFIANATTVTLAAPTGADGFNVPVGPPARVLGRGLRPVGSRYGIAVVAQEFPSDVEVEEALETAVGSGVYGAWVTMGRLSSVSGDWTLWGRTLPNSQLKRKLRARHVSDGATASAYTAEVVIDPNVHDPLAPYIAVHGSLTMQQDGTSVLSLDGSSMVNSYRYATSTSAYPSDATAAAGTAINGRAIADVAIAFLDYGQRVYITVVPFTGANGAGTAGASLRLTVTRVGGTDIPQGTVAIAATGAASFSFEGPTWAGSYRWAASTSAFPNDATTATSGTVVNGRVQASVASGLTLALGQTVYITIVPFRATGAAGYQGGAVHLSATRHDFSATKTVYFPASALTPYNQHSATRYTIENGHLTRTGVAPAEANVILVCPIVVPSGVTITGLSFNVYEDVATTGLVQCDIDELSDTGTITDFAFVDSSNVGWQTLALSISWATATKKNLRVRFILNNGTDNPVTQNYLRVASFSYTYTMPDSAKAV